MMTNGNLVGATNVASMPIKVPQYNLVHKDDGTYELLAEDGTIINRYTEDELCGTNVNAQDVILDIKSKDVILDIKSKDVILDIKSKDVILDTDVWFGRDHMGLHMYGSKPSYINGMYGINGNSKMLDHKVYDVDSLSRYQHWMPHVLLDQYQGCTHWRIKIGNNIGGTSYIARDLDGKTLYIYSDKPTMNNDARWYLEHKRSFQSSISTLVYQIQLNPELFPCVLPGQCYEIQFIQMNDNTHIDNTHIDISKDIEPLNNDLLL